MAKVRQGLRKSYFILQSHMLMHAFCEHFVTGQAHLMFIRPRLCQGKTRSEKVIFHFKITYSHAFCEHFLTGQD